MSETPTMWHPIRCAGCNRLLGHVRAPATFVLGRVMCGCTVGWRIDTPEHWLDPRWSLTVIAVIVVVAVIAAVRMRGHP